MRRWLEVVAHLVRLFKAKMAQVLCVYREVSVLKKAAAAATKKNKPCKAVTVISYDEKPGIKYPPNSLNAGVFGSTMDRASGFGRSDPTMSGPMTSLPIAPMMERHSGCCASSTSSPVRT